MLFNSFLCFSYKQLHKLQSKTLCGIGLAQHIKLYIGTERMEVVDK